jgi:hypothetical protein
MCLLYTTRPARLRYGVRDRHLHAILAGDEATLSRTANDSIASWDPLAGSGIVRVHRRSARRLIRSVDDLEQTLGTSIISARDMERRPAVPNLRTCA